MCIRDRYIEGENLTREEFYEKLAVSERLPKTAQITPVEFEEAFRPYVEAGEEIVVLPLACLLYTSKPCFSNLGLAIYPPIR